MMEDDTIEEGYFFEEIQRLLTPTVKNNFDEYFAKVIPKAHLKEFGRKDYNYAYVSMFPLETKEKKSKKELETVKKRKKVPTKMTEKMTAEVIVAQPVNKSSLKDLEREFEKYISLGDEEKAFRKPEEKRLVKVKDSVCNKTSLSKNYEKISQIIKNDFSAKVPCLLKEEERKKDKIDEEKLLCKWKNGNKAARKSCQAWILSNIDEKKESAQLSSSQVNSNQAAVLKNLEKERNEKKPEEKKPTSSFFLKKTFEEKKQNVEESKKVEKKRNSPPDRPLLNNVVLMEKINKKAPISIPVQPQLSNPEVFSNNQRKSINYSDMSYNKDKLSINNSNNNQKNMISGNVVQVNQESDGEDDCSLINKKPQNNVLPDNNKFQVNNKQDFNHNSANNNRSVNNVYPYPNLNFNRNISYSIPNPNINRNFMNLIPSFSNVNQNVNYSNPNFQNSLNSPIPNQNFHNIPPQYKNYLHNKNFGYTNKNYKNFQNNYVNQFKSQPIYNKNVDKQEFYRKKYGIDGQAANEIINNNPKFSRGDDNESAQNNQNQSNYVIQNEENSEEANNFPQKPPNISNNIQIHNNSLDSPFELNVGNENLVQQNHVSTGQNSAEEFNLDSFLDNFSKKPKTATNDKKGNYTIVTQEKTSPANDLESFILQNFNPKKVVKTSDDIDDFLSNFSKQPQNNQLAQQINIPSTELASHLNIQQNDFEQPLFDQAPQYKPSGSNHILVQNPKSFNNNKNIHNSCTNPVVPSYSNDSNFNVLPVESNNDKIFINNNFNFSKINIINHDFNIIKDEISQCLSCQWRFPLNFTINEKNAHIDRCFEGYGQQDKENYLSSLSEVNKMEAKPKPEAAPNDNFVCIVCKKYKNSNMGILEKHINDCLEEETAKEKYTGKKRTHSKSERFNPEDFDNSRVFFRKKFN